MKNNQFFNETIIATILIVLLILFLNPFDFLMPPPFISMFIIILMTLFGIFVSIIWKEHVHDEREGFHRMLAGRFAFLIGSGILITGIIIQELRHKIDPWLIYALAGMLIAKIVGVFYGKKKY